MIKIIFLTEKFYEDYKACSEIEKKQNRPYTMILATINNIDFAVPLRSHINHEHVMWTNKEQKCGLDFSKAVVITNKAIYIDTNNTPYIRTDEFKVLKGKEYIIKQKMEGYINKYIKAYNKQHIPRNQMLCSYSTLQYFHKELQI